MTKKEDGAGGGADGGGGGGGGGGKGGIGHIFKGLFRAKKSDKRDEKVAIRRQKSEPAAVSAAANVNFGIETTEVLPHYQRARPPQKRRRPTRGCQVRDGIMGCSIDKMLLSY